MKKNVMVSIDEDLHRVAKGKNINISTAAERGIKSTINEERLKEDKGLSCYYCGVELSKQTKEDLEHGLVWLIPDEQWCCPECLRKKTHKIIIGVTENV